MSSLRRGHANLLCILIRLTSAHPKVSIVVLNLRIKNTKKQKVISGFREKEREKKDDGPKKALCVKL